MLKSLFKPPIDYTAEMDALQFARQAKKEAMAHLPEDSSTWTEEHWSIEDEWEAKVPKPSNPDCICKGIVTSNEGMGGWVKTFIMLNPAPKHFAIPKQVMVYTYLSTHSTSDFKKMARLSVGDLVEVKGVFYPPTSYIEKEDEARPGEYFKLKETRESRKHRGY